MRARTFAPRLTPIAPITPIARIYVIYAIYVGMDTGAGSRGLCYIARL